MKQKTNKFLSVIMAAAFLTGMASSSNEDEGTAGGSTTKGEPTTMQFVINAPKAPTTYAPTDNNATDAEVELKTVNVLIYEYTATGFQLEKNASLTMADFEAVAGTDKYELKESSKIATTTGQKKIYVAMNYNGGNLPSIVESSITDVKTLEATLTNYDDLQRGSSSPYQFRIKSRFPSNMHLPFDCLEPEVHDHLIMLLHIYPVSVEEYQAEEW